MVTRHEYELAKAVEVAAALQKIGWWIDSIDGTVITVHGTPDFQVRVTAIDPELSGGFGLAPGTLDAITTSLDAVLQDIADELTEEKPNATESRRSMGIGEAYYNGQRYSIGPRIVPRRSDSGYRRMVA